MSTPAPGEEPAPAAGPRDRLLATPPGTRIVVRSRIVSGFTDTLGDLVNCDGTVAQIDTRTGRHAVVVAHVVAMRVVPPPPTRPARAAPPPPSGDHTPG